MFQTTPQTRSHPQSERFPTNGSNQWSSPTFHAHSDSAFAGTWTANFAHFCKSQLSQAGLCDQPQGCPIPQWDGKQNDIKHLQHRVHCPVHVLPSANCPTLCTRQITFIFQIPFDTSHSDSDQWTGMLHLLSTTTLTRWPRPPMVTNITHTLTTFFTEKRQPWATQEHKPLPLRCWATLHIFHRIDAFSRLNLVLICGDRQRCSNAYNCNNSRSGRGNTSLQSEKCKSGSGSNSYQTGLITLLLVLRISSPLLISNELECTAFFLWTSRTTRESVCPS